jgi:hypothetical protein
MVFFAILFSPQVSSSSNRFGIISGGMNSPHCFDSPDRFADKGNTPCRQKVKRLP